MNNVIINKIILAPSRKQADKLITILQFQIDAICLTLNGERIFYKKKKTAAHLRVVMISLIHSMILKIKYEFNFPQGFPGKVSCIMSVVTVSFIKEKYHTRAGPDMNYAREGVIT